MGSSCGSIARNQPTPLTQKQETHNVPCPNTLCRLACPFSKLNANSELIPWRVLNLLGVGIRDLCVCVCGCSRRCRWAKIILDSWELSQQPTIHLSLTNIRKIGDSFRWKNRGLNEIGPPSSINVPQCAIQLFPPNRCHCHQPDIKQEKCGASFAFYNACLCLLHGEARSMNQGRTTKHGSTQETHCSKKQINCPARNGCTCAPPWNPWDADCRCLTGIACPKNMHNK